MEQSLRQPQPKEKQPEHLGELRGTSMQEIYASMMRKRGCIPRYTDGCDNDDYDDDDADCYCE